MTDQNPTANRSALPERSLARTPLGLRWGLLSYLVLVTLLITLVPFRFYWPSEPRLLWLGGWLDAACNFLLFLPLGFLYRLTREPQTTGHLRTIFCIGLAASAGIEGLQLFLPGRYASPVDVLMNGLESLMGAWLCDRTKRLVDRRWAGRFALELPLMNVVYLFAPLIWLNGLAAGDDRQHSYLSWRLGVCGSVVLAGIYRYRLGQTGRFPALLLCLLAAVWFVGSSLPEFLVSPSVPVGGALLVVLAVAALLV
ncbi:MAG: VanZ family protein [Acidimicrobiia bacterium]|nr:VanZ family protein [Acidimicrobiia bacterium]